MVQWNFWLIICSTFVALPAAKITLTCDETNKICELHNLNQNSYPSESYNFHNLNVTVLSIAENVTIVGENVIKLPKNLISAFPNLRNLVAEKCGLKKLDPSLFGGSSAENLLTLNLGGNQFPAELAERLFASANNLQELQLHECEISSIHSQAFEGLGQLEVLTLNFNHISVLDTVVWSPLKALTSLYLIGNQLLKLDFNVFQLNTKLTELEVGANKISTLVAPKFQMTLKWLDLDANHLTDIEPLKQLTSLEFLLLSFNPQIVLPSGIFGPFSNLKILHLVAANLNRQSATFAEIFGNLPKLQVLSIGKNAIGQLKIDELPKLPNLRFFHIFENELETINDFKALKEKFPNLVKTDISQNKWNCTELSAILDGFKAQNIAIDFVDDYPNHPRNGKVEGRHDNLEGVGCTHFDDFIFSKLEALEESVVLLKNNATTIERRLKNCENHTGQLTEQFQKDLRNISSLQQIELKAKDSEIQTTVAKVDGLNGTINVYNYSVLLIFIVFGCLLAVSFFVGRHFGHNKTIKPDGE